MCVELKKDYILEMSKSRSILGFAVPLQYFAKAQQLHSSRQGTIHILRKHFQEGGGGKNDFFSHF